MPNGTFTYCLLKLLKGTLAGTKWDFYLLLMTSLWDRMGLVPFASFPGTVNPNGKRPRMLYDHQRGRTPQFQRLHYYDATNLNHLPYFTSIQLVAPVESSYNSEDFTVTGSTPQEQYTIMKIELSTCL